MSRQSVGRPVPAAAPHKTGGHKPHTHHASNEMQHP